MWGWGGAEQKLEQRNELSILKPLGPRAVLRLGATVAAVPLFLSVSP